MKPVTEIPAYAVIVRAIHERGAAQREAFAELARRGAHGRTPTNPTSPRSQIG